MIKVIHSGSAGNCIILNTGVGYILLDAGVPLKKILREVNFNILGIKAVFLTHSHGDHSKAVKDIITKGIDVYAGQKTFIELKVKRSGVFTHTVKPKRTYSIGYGVKFIAFELEHDVYNLGYLISIKGDKKVLYAVDSPYIPIKTTGLTHLLIEANYCEDKILSRAKTEEEKRELIARIIGSHASMKSALKFIERIDKSKLEEIHFLHLSNDHSDIEIYKELIKDRVDKSVKVYFHKGGECYE